jgi:serine/threonine protein phosphatase PrpC
MTATPSQPTERLPRQADIDVHGASERGHVRRTNADHFLILSLHRAVQVHHTNVPATLLEPSMSGPRGYLFLVADGVGSGPGGEHASESALGYTARCVTHCADLYYRSDVMETADFAERLRSSMLKVHRQVRAEAEAGHQGRQMATTLTMVAVFWPAAYLVHVGDSRCYRIRDGRLELLSRDQTFAQALVDAGAMTETGAKRSPLRHMLTSAVGAEQADPEVKSETCQWDDVLLLCSDGLTRHVSDDEIAEHLSANRPARETVDALIALALERGGEDNVTAVVGRLKQE